METRGKHCKKGYQKVKETLRSDSCPEETRGKHWKKGIQRIQDSFRGYQRGALLDSTDQQRTRHSSIQHSKIQHVQNTSDNTVQFMQTECLQDTSAGVLPNNHICLQSPGFLSPELMSPEGMFPEVMFPEVMSTKYSSEENNSDPLYVPSFLTSIN